MTGGITSKTLRNRGSSETQKMRATIAARNPKTAIGSLMSAVFAVSMGFLQLWRRL